MSIHKSSKDGSLVDRGANRGIAGGDVRIIEKTGCSVDVRGIDNHQITDIPIVTAGAVVTTQQGPVIVILHQYAYTGQGKTIHSSAQLNGLPTMSMISQSKSREGYNASSPMTAISSPSA